MDDQKLRELFDKNTGILFGKAVCIVSKNGENVFHHNKNCGMESLFDLASVSKILTATMIFKLIGEGSLALDQTLDVPFNSAPTGNTTKTRFKKITVQSLLTHSSGLPAWFPFYTQTGSFWEILEIALNKYPVNEGTVYSDLGFMLLGEIITIITARTLLQNLALLNDDLGTSFTYNPKNADICVETERGNRIEEGMCKDRELSFNDFRSSGVNMRGQVNDGNAFYFWKGVAGHAGVFGPAADLIKLGELYLNRGKAAEKQIFPSQLAEKTHIDYGNGRGLMWLLSDVFPDGFGHTGFTGTSLYICPSKCLVSVILTNRLVMEPAPDLRNFRTEAHKIIYD